MNTKNDMPSWFRYQYLLVLILFVLNTGLPLNVPIAAQTDNEVPSALGRVKIPSIRSQPSQIIFQVNSLYRARRLQHYALHNGATEAVIIPELKRVVVTIPSRVASRMVQNAPSVVAIEQDSIAQALNAPPTDPYYPQQWALDMLRFPDMWTFMTPNSNAITIAVIDSGICVGHPDINTIRIDLINAVDYVDGDTMPQDEFGHGCAISGIIAANADNGEGITGAIPYIKILPLRVLNENGWGSYSDIAQAIIHAAGIPEVKVINLSLGGMNDSMLLQDAVAYANSQGKVIIAASGNTGTEGVMFPARYTDVIAVGSIGANRQRSSFSTFGTEVDVLAPGEDVWGTWHDSLTPYMQLNGTSFATAYVSAAAAVELSIGNSFQPSGILSFSTLPEFCLGDVNADNEINILDVQSVSGRYGITQSDYGYLSRYDTIFDGKIDKNDVEFVINREAC